MLSWWLEISIITCTSILNVNIDGTLTNFNLRKKGNKKIKLKKQKTKNSLVLHQSTQIITIKVFFLFKEN